MKRLKTENVSSASLADFALIFTYTATANIYVTPTIKVTNLASLAGNYIARVMINDIIITPERAIYVNGLESIRMTGKPFVLAANDVVKILLKGNVNDTSASITTSLYDLTPQDTLELAGLLIPEIERAIIEYLPTINLAVSNSRLVLSPAASLIKGCNMPITRTVRPQEAPDHSDPGN